MKEAMNRGVAPVGYYTAVMPYERGVYEHSRSKAFLDMQRSRAGL